MQVGIGIGGKIVVDGQVDTLDIDTTTEDISGDADTLVELLEFLVALDARGLLAMSRRVPCHRNLPLLLADTGVDSDTGEVALAQELVELVSTLGALNEDDDLVELQVI